ncbi:sugar ABC transporter substrate-binding protein [Bdellovibrio sp. NC01]|nr:sugar ABC transporter substrate-binding protein [Bdellovibrio sp. NC01]
MKIEGQVLMRKGLEEETAKFNAKNLDKIELTAYVAGEGRDGIIKQVEQLKQAVKKSSDAIIIQPTDNAALAEGLQLANQHNIPVIAYDQYIVGGKLSGFVTSDNYQGGFDNGNHIDSLFPAKKEIKIVVFEYPQVSSTTERVDGFFDALREKHRRFQVVQRYEAVDPESGKNAVAKFLRDYPEKNSVDVVLTVNDGGGLSVVKELLAKKRTEIKHATFDGDPLSIENIKAGRLTVIDSAQFCAELGRRSIRTLIRVMKGETEIGKVRVPTFPVTLQNVNSYPGWMGVPAETKPVVKPTTTPLKKYPGGNVVFKVGTTPLCPYICEKRPGVWTGYLFEILGEIARQQGIELRLESVPYSRLVQSLQQHKVDYIITPQYLVRYTPDVQVVGSSLGVSFTGALLPKNEDISLVDNNALKKMKVVYSDFGYEGRMEIVERGNRLTGVDVADRMIKMMKEQRADVALGDYNVLRYELTEKDATLKLQPTAMTGFSFFVLAGLQKNPQVEYLGDRINEWFMNSRDNGRLEGILKKYNLSDWRALDRY